MSAYLDDVDEDDATLLVVEAGSGAAKEDGEKSSAHTPPDPADDPVTTFVYVLAGFSAIGGLLFGYDIGCMATVIPAATPEPPLDAISIPPASTPLSLSGHRLNPFSFCDGIGPAA